MTADGSPDLVTGEVPADWAAWLRDAGRWRRRLRETLALSQTELATEAGISQASLSRLETGRGLLTPLVVFVKVDAALRRRLHRLDPKTLAPDIRRWLAGTAALGPS